MPWRVMALWIVGLVTIIPFCVYRLFWVAEPVEYPFLIVVPLVWVFGFWPVAGPLVLVWRIGGFMKRIQKAQNIGDLKEAYEKHDGRDLVIEVVARESGIPRFIAEKIYDKVVERLKEQIAESPAPDVDAPAPLAGPPSNGQEGSNP